MSHTLILRDVSCVRGGICLYEHISRRADPGICWMVTGSNGAGKTTFLRQIAGLIPGQGTINWRGHGNPAPLFLSATAMVKESFTVIEMLNFYQSLAQKSDISVLHVARRWRLSFCLDMPLSDLSSGQRQRVSHARLDLDPRPVWILDEPYVHLDLNGTAVLNDVLHSHLNRGGFLMMASHIAPPEGTLFIDLNGGGLS